MTTILKPTIKKILTIFYERKNESFHLRAIARKTELYGQSITRYLNQLEQDKILFSKKDGNLKKYSLRKNKTTFALLTLFDVDKFNKLPLIKQQAIDLFIDSLSEKPLIALLFGSTAKQTFTDKSDIDVLLIVNKKINPTNAIKKVDAQTAQKISVFQITIKEFETELKLKEDHVVQSAIQTGYPIINHIYYYRCVNNE